MWQVEKGSSDLVVFALTQEGADEESTDFSLAVKLEDMEMALIDSSHRAVVLRRPCTDRPVTLTVSGMGKQAIDVEPMVQENTAAQVSW